MELYSKKVCEISLSGAADELGTALSHLTAKEKEFLMFLLKNRLFEFTPIEISRQLNVTNKTVINRCARLVSNGFLVPNIVKERIRSYTVSKFAKENDKAIISALS